MWCHNLINLIEKHLFPFVHLSATAVLTRWIGFVIAGWVLQPIHHPSGDFPPNGGAA
jgi:hypothetical protein